MKKILLLNGPNLNLLGRREPSLYGGRSFEDFLLDLRGRFPQISIDYYQSNHEGDLIDCLHEAGFAPEILGIVLNAGGYTHTSVALADAVLAIARPVIEVHISNVQAREAFRHHSYLAPVCKGSIVGLGLEGYALAVQWLLQQQDKS